MTERTGRTNQTAEMVRPHERVPSEPVVGSVEDVIVRKKVGPRVGIGWVVGNQAEGKYFFGKQSETTNLTQMVTSHHTAGIEGGPGTGKTSALFNVAARLKENGVIKRIVKVVLSTDGKEDAVKVVELEMAKLGKRARIAILADGEPWENHNLATVIDYLTELRNRGHYVLVGVYGDYRYHPGIDEETRQAFGELLGDNVVVNKLMSDEQVRSLMRRGGRPVFSKAVEDYLISEAGGHPLLAGMLADETFRTASSIKLGWRRIEWQDFWEEIRREVNRMMGDTTDDFGRSVRYIREAGFDPRTWEFNGDPRINQEVYRNMLPRRTSTVFRNWLNDQIKEKI